MIEPQVSRIASKYESVFFPPPPFPTFPTRKTAGRIDNTLLITSVENFFDKSDQQSVVNTSGRFSSGRSGKWGWRKKTAQNPLLNFRLNPRVIVSVSAVIPSLHYSKREGQSGLSRHNRMKGGKSLVNRTMSV